MSKLIRGALYARFSSIASNPLSNDDQLRMARAYALSHGIQVVADFRDDAKHGEAIENRPGFLEMVERVQLGEFDAVIVEEADRLARSTSKGLGFFDICKFYDCEVITLSDGIESSSSITQKFAQAQHANRVLAAKVRRGQLAAVTERGQYIGGLAYGYEVDWVGKPPVAIRKINEAQAPYVLRAFQEYDAGMGTTAICKRLNEEGVAGPGARRRDGRGVWDPGVLTGSPKLNSGIFRNPTYLGQPRYGNKMYKRHPISGARVTAQFANPQPSYGDAPHLQIVPQDLFERVQVRLNGAGKKGGPRAKPPAFLLSGKMKCAECGHSYVMIERRYMACSGHARVGGCSNNRRISYQEAEDGFIQNLTSLLNKPDAAEVYVNAYIEALAEKVSAAPNEILLLTRRRDELEKKILGLLESLAVANMSSAVRARIVEQMAEFESEKALISNRICEVEVPPRVVGTRDDIASSMRSQLQTLTAVMGTDSVAGLDARNAIRALVDKITVEPLPAPLGKERGFRGATLHVEGQISSLLKMANGVHDFVMVLGQGLRNSQYHELGTFSFQFEIGHSNEARRPSKSYGIVHETLKKEGRPLHVRELIDAVRSNEPMTRVAAQSRVRSSLKRLIAQGKVEAGSFNQLAPQSKTYLSV
ncbi:recombinase family protein [Brevundimonas sp.]|uniref:recombinase family protein n=1 Tax=Brevundimonas sp. TaxID=1871086 RepID=UPI0035644058